LKDTFINGLAVMADSFLASSRMVGGLYQLRDLIIQNGGLFRQAGTWLGEGFVWAKEKVIGVVGFIRDRLPTIIDVATQVGDAIVRGVSWAYGALVRFGGLVIENLPRIKDAIVATWDFAIEGAHKFLLGVIAVKDTISSPEFWSEVGSVITQVIGQAIIGLGRIADMVVVKIGEGIDGLISKIPGVKTTSTGDYLRGLKIGEGIAAQGTMALAGLTGSKGLTDAVAGVSLADKMKATGMIPREKYAKARNEFPTLRSMIPDKVNGLMDGPPSDPQRDQALADKIAAAMVRATGGKFSSGHTLVSQANYQPGANNIAFYQRLQGLSGGVI
ncbi:MAG: hypothetical protein KC994_26845, partial [Candidatus Omnitrophica bacterium]|nr:hypothetical protein [Candidatus Omnitrophota bacterium]